jgi:ribose 5-phosphate isomerase B
MQKLDLSDDFWHNVRKHLYHGRLKFKVKIVIGNDHRGYEMKLYIKEYLIRKGHEVTDAGAHGTERVDYPPYVKKAAGAVAKGEYDFGILICGTGVGMAIAANKIKGVRAVVCSEPYSAKQAREHNNANVLAFGARVIGEATAEMIVDAFIESGFFGGRYQERIEMAEEIEST